MSEKEVENGVPLEGRENYYYWPLDVLTVYLQNKLYFRITDGLQKISPLLRKICADIEDTRPGCKELASACEDLVYLINADFSRDAKIMFPYIREVVKAHQDGSLLSSPEFSSISLIYEQAWKKYQHRREGFKNFIYLLKGIDGEPVKSQSLKELITELEAVFRDFEEAVVLKFDVLYKRAIEMENVVSRYTVSCHNNNKKNKNEKFR